MSSTTCFPIFLLQRLIHQRVLDKRFCVLNVLHANGYHDLWWFSGSVWPCHDSSLFVSWSIACELSVPLWKLRDTLGPLALHVLAQFLPQPSVLEHLCEFGYPKVSAEPLAQPGSSPCRSFVVDPRTIILARPAVCAASRAYSTFCPLCRARYDLCFHLVLAIVRMSSITVAALRLSTDLL